MESGQWIKKGSLSDISSFRKMTALPGNKLLVTGGRVDAAGWFDTASTEVYADGKWSLGPPLDQTRVEHCQVQAGTKTVVIGDIKNIL